MRRMKLVPFSNDYQTTQKDITHFIGGRASVELLDQLIHQSSSTHSSKQDAPNTIKNEKKNQRPTNPSAVRFRS